MKLINLLKYRYDVLSKISDSKKFSQLADDGAWIRYDRFQFHFVFHWGIRFKLYRRLENCVVSAIFLLWKLLQKYLKFKNVHLLFYDSSYNSNWTNLPTRMKKSLSIIHCRCNKVCVVSAYGIFNARRQDFTKVKLIFSYNIWTNSKIMST